MKIQKQLSQKIHRYHIFNSLLLQPVTTFHIAQKDNRVNQSVSSICALLRTCAHVWSVVTFCVGYCAHVWLCLRTYVCQRSACIQDDVSLAGPIRSTCFSCLIANRPRGQLRLLLHLCPFLLILHQSLSTVLMITICLAILIKEVAIRAPFHTFKFSPTGLAHRVLWAQVMECHWGIALLHQSSNDPYSHMHVFYNLCSSQKTNNYM